MNTHADKTQGNKSQSVANSVSQKKQKKNAGESTFLFVDNRPEAVAQRKLQEMANNSPQAKQAAQLQAMADNYSARQQWPIQRVSKDDYSGQKLLKFIKVRNKLKDSRAGYSNQEIERILREVPKQDMDIILSWPNDDIDNLKWNMNGLDILKDPSKFMAQIPKYHTIKVFFQDLSGAHGADMAAASTTAIASITRSYSQGTFIMNPILTTNQAEADVKVFVLGPATLRALGFSFGQQMQFTRQRAWTPGHGDTIYINRTKLPPNNPTFAATVAHEVGHALGLEHPDALSVEATQPNIMNQTATGLLAEVASQEQLQQIRGLASRGKISLGI